MARSKYRIANECTPPPINLPDLQLANPYWEQYVAGEGRINLTDDVDAIADKCRKAQSDAEPGINYDPGRRTAVANLVSGIDLLAAVRETTPEEIVKAAEGWDIVQLKEALAVETEALIAPIRDRYETITKDPQEIYRILEMNEEKARATVSHTMKIVLKAVGFR
ncbi:hypothetical protein PRIPAC_93006 [Pristionchus pacificus]|uniref:Uncharacterized protein n=1 Tax=Pristionchus pacificus TaxID=54126 RepID=A0A2A6BIK6_PRIPA|nr:hypothetical protein PRIPAC_93006 [Pristionchus pacificus]|eukprot:PDM65717.1 hypothetical protein PRIPAC_45631 [Pristionchus pacificus]